MKNKSLKKNIIISVSVQAVSLSVSFILSFLVPKFIDQYNYAYWQVYVLYSNYVGILHFGLLDGIVLRYSKYNYEDLNKPLIRSQFQILLISVTFFSMIIALLSISFLDEINQKIFLFISISVITKNWFTYNSYLLQITNRINKYAILILCQRICYGVVTLLLLTFGIKSFEWFCFADILGDIFGIVISFNFNRGLYFGHPIRMQYAIKEWKNNVFSGIFLMFANWSALLLTGSAKMIIQWHWDPLVFGQVSFTFSLTSLFLVFISAISVVLFPSLKRMDSKELPNTYVKIRNIISPLLLIGIICYFPVCMFVRWFLPNYITSLKYLSFLLPMVIYSSKVSLLTNNYLKSYRQENKMFMINLISTAISVILFIISAYILNSIESMLISVVVGIMINSIISEVNVGKIIDKKFCKQIIVECVISFLFIVAAQQELLLGFIFYFVVIFIYMIFCPILYK